MRRARKRRKRRRRTTRTTPRLSRRRRRRSCTVPWPSWAGRPASCAGRCARPSSPRRGARSWARLPGTSRRRACLSPSSNGSVPCSCRGSAAWWAPWPFGTSGGRRHSRSRCRGALHSHRRQRDRSRVRQHYEGGLRDPDQRPDHRHHVDGGVKPSIQPTN